MRHENSQINQARNILDCILMDAQKTAETLAEEAVCLLSGSSAYKGDGIRLSDEHRQTLQGHIRKALLSNPLCNGAGFASYAATQTNQGYWTLEWWRQEGKDIKQAQLEHNQEARQSLDFRLFDWFEQPARHHRPFVDGPYVDYVCNGAYTITAAHPVLIDDTFVGVAAVDVLVSTLERFIQPALGAIGQPALVINGDSRVVTSAMSGVRPGSLWKGKDRSRISSSEGNALHLVVLVTT